MSRARLNIFLEPDHARRLAQLAGMKGISKSAIIASALASYLSPDGGDRREAAIAKRLDKLTRQFDRLERDQTILIETVALFVRYTLTVNAPIPAAHQDAARAQGRERFQQFVDQLARHLQRGRSLVAQVSEEITPAADGFFGDDLREEEGGEARTSLKDGNLSGEGAGA
ncbi:CopG family transcriptional regulator [Sphingomonas sp. CCH5-D11]|uniref:CopG family transcriptional regulator n=1 Tax=Sphingomonas sp. CCH5-D11 TaxID=1768786 RepID=UPI000AC20F43|nr:CopG family transcriptional regulator [Sphingomonas sp. CCH5-D11]